MKKLLILLFLIIQLDGFSQILPGVFSSVNNTIVDTSIVSSLIANVTSIYEFDEVSGTNVIDDRSNLNGVNVGATVNQSPLIADGGKAYDFDGTDYVDFNTNLINGFPYSFSVWIIPTATIVQHFIFSSHYSPLTGRYYGVTFDYKDNKFAISYGDGNGNLADNRKTYEYNYTFSVGDTLNIIVTSVGWNQADNKVYINGSEVSYSTTTGTATSVQWVDATSESRFSQRWTFDNTQRVIGIVDQVIVSDSIFGTTDIATIYGQK